MITSIVRWSEFFDVRFITANQPIDPWHDNPLAIWNVVEPSIYLISACMLSYRPLFRTIAQSSFASSVETWLHKPKTYTSFDNPRTKPSERSLTKFARGGGTYSKESNISPFVKSLTPNGEASAERGDSIELETPRIGMIHVEQEFDVVSQGTR